MSDRVREIIDDLEEWGYLSEGDADRYGAYQTAKSDRKIEHLLDELDDVEDDHVFEELFVEIANVIRETVGRKDRRIALLEAALEGLVAAANAADLCVSAGIEFAPKTPEFEHLRGRLAKLRGAVIHARNELIFGKGNV